MLMSTVLLLKLHKTGKWVLSSYVCAYAYVYVAAVFICAYAYACACAYALVKTSLKAFLLDI